MFVVDSGNGRILKYVPTEEEMNRGKDEAAKAAEPGTGETPRPAVSRSKPGTQKPSSVGWRFLVPGLQHLFQHHSQDSRTGRRRKSKG